MNPDPTALNGPQAEEPKAGSARAPVWLFVLTALLAFWGMGFLDKHGGGFNPQVYGPYESIADLGRDQPVTKGSKRLNAGRAAFKIYCAPCHLETGLGNAANNVPPLVHSEWVLAEGPNRLIRIVLNGLQGPVKVDGKDFDSNGMLPWRDTVTDDEVIAQILTYIRMSPEWGQTASEITGEQVTKIRDETKDRAVQWTIGELLKVSEK
jgi:mono/diheme cytochrome c family protein